MIIWTDTSLCQTRFPWFEITCQHHKYWKPKWSIWSMWTASSSIAWPQKWVVDESSTTGCVYVSFLLSKTQVWDQTVCFETDFKSKTTSGYFLYNSVVFPAHVSDLKIVCWRRIGKHHRKSIKMQYFHIRFLTSMLLGGLSVAFDQPGRCTRIKLLCSFS